MRHCEYLCSFTVYFISHFSDVKGNKEMTRQEKLEMLQTEGRPGWLEKIMNTVRFISKLFSLLPHVSSFSLPQFCEGNTFI